MLTQHNRKTCRLSPDYTFAIRELGVWSGDETTMQLEHLNMMSQHSNSLATATAAILQFLVHNENLLRLCMHQNGRCFHGKRMHANALLALSG